MGLVVYVRNDPVNLIDPDGRRLVIISGQYRSGYWVGKPGEHDFPEIVEEGFAELWIWIEPPPPISNEDIGDSGGRTATPDNRNPMPQNRELLPSALGRAIDALRQNKECFDLFGNENARSGDFNPINILSSIAKGTEFGNIEFKALGKGVVAKTNSAGRLPIPGLAGKVIIFINTYNSDTGLYWNDANVDENAETLLHELGHAFNYLRGSGGFAISELGEIRNRYAFDNRIRETCFPKK